jgi:uncharacterized phage protein (TIGR01671 family)
MKREIKFRGKVKHHDPMTNPENGWAEGYYFQDLTQGEMRSFIFQPPCNWEVIPETEGQFTGLFDFSKKKIWEGDIVNVSCLNYTGLAVIKFIDGAFCMVGENWIESLNGFDTDSLDIIGNIHDTPELLKTETL